MSKLILLIDLALLLAFWVYVVWRVGKEVEQVPEDLRQRFIDMFTRLNDKTKEDKK